MPFTAEKGMPLSKQVLGIKKDPGRDTTFD